MPVSLYCGDVMCYGCCMLHGGRSRAACSIACGPIYSRWRAALRAEAPLEGVSTRHAPDRDLLGESISAVQDRRQAGGRAGGHSQGRTPRTHPMTGTYCAHDGTARKQTTAGRADPTETSRSDLVERPHESS